ncbi:MAG: DUF1559 domain-containing protein [Planctomycetaceae bacterium]|nr:DUF1559 domain-containing protein [Planctomycetaceae bacterium]
MSIDRRNKPSLAFTFIELLFVVSFLGILIALLLPAINSAREATRRIRCVNRLRQISMGIANYESAHARFPAGRLLPDWIHQGRVQHAYTNYNRVDQRAAQGEWTGFRSVHIWILPYLESNEIYQMIDLERPSALRMSQAGQPYNINYDAYATAENMFICPSDPYTVRIISENNYRYNFGGSTPYGGAYSTSRQASHDATVGGHSILGNGAFTAGKRGMSSRKILDGLSKTAFFSERTKGSGVKAATKMPTASDIVTMPGREDRPVSREAIFRRCKNYRPRSSRFNFTSAGRWLPGSDYSNGWPFAGYAGTMYNHVAPPNWTGQDCGNWSAIPDTPGEHAIVSARSHHSGTVNVSFGDAHVASIDDTIDLDIWRAIGTRNGKEDRHLHQID